MSWPAPSAGFDARSRVVVVGSGAGGAMAALTLAEAGLDVLVVEEGHPYDGAPLGMLEALERHYADAGYRITSGSPRFPVAGGRAVGGSTVVNSALCFRTPPDRLDAWNDESGGAFADTAHFWRTQDAVERVLRVTETPDALLSGNDRAQAEAAARLGWRGGPIRRNAPACTGCGRCNMGCPVGGKYSVDVALLPRAAAAGARVVPGCRVDRVAPGEVSGEVRAPWARSRCAPTRWCCPPGPSPRRACSCATASRAPGARWATACGSSR